MTKGCYLARDGLLRYSKHVKDGGHKSLQVNLKDSYILCSHGNIEYLEENRLLLLNYLLLKSKVHGTNFILNEGKNDSTESVYIIIVTGDVSSRKFKKAF